MILFILDCWIWTSDISITTMLHYILTFTVECSTPELNRDDNYRWKKIPDAIIQVVWNRLGFHYRSFQKFNPEFIPKHLWQGNIINKEVPTPHTPSKIAKIVAINILTCKYDCKKWIWGTFKVMNTQGWSAQSWFQWQFKAQIFRSA